MLLSIGCLSWSAYSQWSSGRNIIQSYVNKYPLKTILLFPPPRYRLCMFGDCMTVCIILLFPYMNIVCVCLFPYIYIYCIGLFLIDFYLGQKFLSLILGSAREWPLGQNDSAEGLLNCYNYTSNLVGRLVTRLPVLILRSKVKVTVKKPTACLFIKSTEQCLPTIVDIRWASRDVCSWYNAVYMIL